LSDEIVNVEGGAAAHGHPIGATGAILTTKLFAAASSRCASAVARASRWRSKRCIDKAFKIPGQ
jgi:acetyl-CoA acetyltransferase